MKPIDTDTLLAAHWPDVVRLARSVGVALSEAAPRRMRKREARILAGVLARGSAVERPRAR